LIVGAGMVGATLAALLAKTGLRVVLADAGERPQASEVMRVSALGRAAARVLDAAGAWEPLASTRSPYRTMVVLDSASGAELRFDAADSALSELGWIVPNIAVQ